MSKKSKAKKPTESELGILTVIWEHQPVTVREVFEHLSSEQDVGYTTVLKLMQIMTDKGLLVRDTSVRPQVYRAAKPQNQTQKQLLRDLLDGAFSGSPGNLVLQALSLRQSSPEELREIRELLDKLEGNS
ncbi:MAG: BlaI/MecI/CopY family transcriptional regulator [Phycisphaerales bacterium JB043]